ncbi:MAG: response regulator [Promethearchaeota archaeon]
MKIISGETKKTGDMLKYEKLTGKYAIWKGNITKGYKKWKNGGKEYYLNQKRITFYVPEALKEEWKVFAKDNDFTTLSNLIRESVDLFIKYRPYDNAKFLDVNLLSKISHELKQPLTLIRAYLQLFLKTYKSKLDENGNDMLKNVMSQTQKLENIIYDNFEPHKEEIDVNMEEEKNQYDILLVEDNIETVKFLTHYFKTNGYSCKGIMRGIQALKELKTIKPKLILLDIILPDISGYEVIKTVRYEYLYRDIPIFFLTAVPGSDVEEKAQDLKATGVILKPFNLEQLDIVFNYIK